MDRTKYNQMVHAQDTQHMNAWNFVTTSWHTNEWRPIPQNIRNILGFHPSLGMYNGNLCTRDSANGAREFIQRMNNRKS